LEHERVIQRALEKKAPFHRDRNSVADAVLIELYSSEAGGNDTADRYCFVTCNYLDFSLPNGDRRQPHHDISGLFADERSRYVYDVIGLNEVLVDYVVKNSSKSPRRLRSFTRSQGRSRKF
jgi:hypothetical protein